MENETLPHSDEAERLVLGTVMNEKNALPFVREMLPVEAFYQDKHREIYRSIIDVADKGNFPDIVMVMEELLRKKSTISPYELTELSGCTTPYLEQYVAVVFDKYKRRQFFEIGCYLRANSFDETEDIMDVYEEVGRRMDGIFPDADNAVHTIKEAIKGVYENIDRNYKGTSRLTGYPTGFSEFDGKSGGLQTSDLIIIASDTSSGKTSLAIKISMNAGCPVAFYSMEMKKEQVAARMMSIQSGVPANEILYSRLASGQLQSIDKGVARLEKLPIYFDDRSTSNIESILASIRMMKIKYGIKGVIVDYLQILNVNMKTANKEQQMGDVARRLKNLAKDLDIWIIALSQLSRDKENPVPTLARLRDSGQIAEASDVVMLIYRPELYGKRYPEPYMHSSVSGTAMIDVAKGRNIGLLKFIVGFDKPTTNFYELDEIPVQREEEAPF
mgnify:FL=1